MARIDRKSLTHLCRRLATAEAAGIATRKTWHREATAARGSRAAVFARIHDAVARGGTITDAITAEAGFFPGLFRELVALGEETGTLAKVFRRLADHYDHQIKLRRSFLAGITWPMIQLGATVIIVGFLIWVLGVIGESHGGEPFDVLGWGLTGNRGLGIYMSILAVLMVIGYVSIQVLRSEKLWAGPVQSVLMRLPKIGTTLRTLAVSRFAWALGMTAEAGMDMKKALALALVNTHSAVFARHVDTVCNSIDAGDSVYLALFATGEFQDDLLDAVNVGEESGRLSETLLHMSEDYQDRARAALATLAILGGFLIWAMVALLIISIVVSVFRTYTNMIYDLSQPGGGGF